MVDFIMLCDCCVAPLLTREISLKNHVVSKGERNHVRLAYRSYKISLSVRNDINGDRKKYYSFIAFTPGNSLPSIYSSSAPPPVDT